MVTNNGKKYLDEIRERLLLPFRNQLLYGLEPNNCKDMYKFRVFDYEASLGKTYQMEHSLVDLYFNKTFNIKDTSKIKSLIVIKTKKECETVENEINSIANEEIAVAVNSSKGLDGKKTFEWHSSKDVGKLKEYPIVIITQEKYFDLCKNLKEAREIFGNRDMLIIDEEVDFVLSSFEHISVSAIAEIEEQYLKVCKNEIAMFKNMVEPIRNALAQKHNKIKREYISSDKSLLEQSIIKFETSLNTSLNDYTFTQLKKDIDKGKIGENDTREDIIKKIIYKVENIMKYFNNDNVLVYNNTLFTYNASIKPFLLKNNIWIDASAKFNFIYELSDVFIKVQDSNRVIDHSNSILYFDKNNKTTTSAKEKYENYPKDILNYIKDSYTKHDKILIITNEDECNYINDVLNEENSYWEGWSISTTNFFRMRGTNEFADYNICFIIQQPQLPFPYYIFLYEYWSNLNKPEDKKIKLSDNDIALNNYIDNDGFKTMGFRNNRHLELVRRTSQASSIYQGLKRIARNAKPKGEFYFFTGDEFIIITVAKQFKNIKTERMELDVKYKDKNNECNTTSKRFRAWLKEKDLHNFEVFELESIAKECCTNVNNLKRVIRANSDIKKMLEENNLIINGKVLKKDADINYFLSEVWDGSDIPVRELIEKYNMTDSDWNNYKRSKAKQEIWKRRSIKTRKVNKVNYLFIAS